MHDQKRQSLALSARSVVWTAGVLFVLAGCAGTLPNRDPTGEGFPEVTGQTLSGESVALPSALAGSPALILIGYQQETQFDIDRWLMGLVQAEVAVPILELPTIPGLVPSFASRWIDAGMRSGIPEEDWGAVVTLYGDAAKPVAELTGTTNGRSTRVIVIDATGKVVWFDDTGYSVSKAIQVAELVLELES